MPSQSKPAQSKQSTSTQSKPAEQSTEYDWGNIVDSLNRYLNLRTIPIGMKRFKTKAEMDVIPKLKRPRQRHALDQIVGQSRYSGSTIGVTAEDLLGAQCAVPVGLMSRSKSWLNGELMAGVWYDTVEDSAKHQQAMDCPTEGYEGLVVSPLVSGRLNPPDICLIFATPGQMILFINGLQYRDYKKLSFTVVGESACADSWGRALKNDEPALSLPCYAERAFGGVADDELLMAIPPRYMPKVIEGLAQLSKNGLRYPIAPWGIQNDPSPSLAHSYGDRSF